MTATEWPWSSRMCARVDPTRPQPMITICTAVPPEVPLPAHGIPIRGAGEDRDEPGWDACDCGSSPSHSREPGMRPCGGGRVELGLGTGWFGAEHAAYGIPFPPLAERFGMLDEQLAIITGLWTTPEQETFSFRGEHYQVTDSPALPKPAQRPRPPVLVGGHGARRTPRIAAAYADEYNVGFSGVADTAAAFGRVREACAAAGRDAASMRYSVAQTVCCGRDRAELDRRAAAIGQDLAALREEGLAGSPAEIADKLGRFAEAGA